MSPEIQRCKYCLTEGRVHIIDLKHRRGFVRLCDVHRGKFIADCKKQYGSIAISLKAVDETPATEMGSDN